MNQRQRCIEKNQTQTKNRIQIGFISKIMPVTKCTLKKTTFNTLVLPSKNHKHRNTQSIVP